ncbi:MAG: HD domain-containing protein, partial [Desulfobacula sp.]|nr:HD domain-containing protein [Desulfobacula sp.]
ANTLENDVFPSLKQVHQISIIAELKKNPNRLVMQFLDNTPDREFIVTSQISSLLSDCRISRIKFDTRLESGQLIKALLVLSHIRKHLFSAQKSEFKPGLSATNSVNLSSLLLDNKGFHKFCARLHVDLDRKIFEIDYSYCELFYTITVNSLLQRYTKTKNHRAIFSLAPKAGIFVFVCLFLSHLLQGSSSVPRLVFALLFSLVTGMGIAYLLNIMASILYDQEHRDKLIEESIREKTSLAHIPINNPNPILKIEAGGNFTFANESFVKQLELMGFPRDSYQNILPEKYSDIVKDCLDTNKTIFNIEVTRHGRTIRYNISPFPMERAVLASGTDITRLKNLEIELRDLNKRLELKVIERTKELQSTQDITILSLSSLAETRDPETGAHLQRTRLYIKLLAEYLQDHPSYKKDLYDAGAIDLLYRSAPLHDIGKVGIPDSILLKPERLTKKEWKLMKTHTTIGGDSLKWAENKLGKNSFLKKAREIAYYHHEKWNGSGYPDGLAGKDIPVACRLMALADVYDALITKRVYKDAFSHEKAKAIIIEGKGKHFDPEIVEAFMKLEKQFIDIAGTYQEPQKKEWKHN